MQPWQPNHVTNQTAPSDFCKSNWPLANGLWQQQFAQFLSLSLSLVLCLCHPVFSLESWEPAPAPIGALDAGWKKRQFWLPVGYVPEHKRRVKWRGWSSVRERRGEVQRPWAQSEISLMHKVKSRQKKKKHTPSFGHKFGQFFKLAFALMLELRENKRSWHG